MENPMLLEKFIQRFGKRPDISVFAPGRANIIGEHTDYNHGFVLPFAIGQGVNFLASANDTHFIHIQADDLQESVTLDLHHSDVSHDQGWIKFVRQIIKVLANKPLKGFDMIFGGNLPIGAGISSSSALTCGFVAVLNKINHLEMDAHDMMWTAIHAERGYGVQGGIMDQFSIINGKRGHAMLLDCASNAATYVDLHMCGYTFYLFNTNVKHNLLHTDYNLRRKECEAAVATLVHHGLNIHSLRDLNVSDLSRIQPLLDQTLYQRASYVIEENQRVMDAIKAFENQDFATLGQLLYQSHDGLAQKYQVSCPELNTLVKMTHTIDAILGARMMGGGFGGCTINLVKGKLNATTLSEIKADYFNLFGIHADIFEVFPSDGIMEYGLTKNGG
jgi:galactokinase